MSIPLDAGAGAPRPPRPRHRQIPACALAAVTIVTLALGAPAAGGLGRDQQRCVLALNKGLAKLAATLGKETLACLKDYARGAVADVQLCVDADRKGRVAKARLKTRLDFARRCTGTDGGGASKLPGTLATDADTVIAAAVANARRMLTGTFGPDVGAAALTEAANEAGARCQAAVAKSLQKCRDAKLKEFNRCKKDALQAGKEPAPSGATTAAELAGCVLADPRGRIARVCDLHEPLPSGGFKVDKVRKDLDGKCVAKGVGLTAVFPHCGSADPEDVHACTERPVQCAACLALDAADGLEADCDLLDDGAANASCQRSLDLLVPAYANPCCDGGPLMWSTLIDVAADPLVRLHVILNPASGPGASPIDANYISDGGGTPTGPLLDVRSAGALVLGYVSTSYATRDVADAKADIDRYYSLAYWRGAGIQVDGVFLDEMSNDLADVGYYQELRDHVRAKDARARVVGNPGVAITFDSSGGAAGFSVADYAAAADTLVTFEHDGNEYRTNYAAPTWLGDLPSSHFAHLVHGEASPVDMQADVALARTRKAGMLYVTDDVLSPNPWDAIATYFDAERGALAP
jgi:Spherulation-specific family 4